METSSKDDITLTVRSTQDVAISVRSILYNYVLTRNLFQFMFILFDQFKISIKLYNVNLLYTC